MTSEKHLKARIRARMAKTGERYAAARRHILGDAPTAAPRDDGGYRLRGGVHPESANIANVLYHHGYSVSEAMVLGVGGGLGAGYILWEWTQHRSKHLTLGFRNRWNYLDWTDKTLDRLGVPYTTHRVGGPKAAAAQLTETLTAGTPAITVPDRQIAGYWHLPEHVNGHGGHQVVAYALTDDGVRLDDRNLGPLTVERQTFDAARARVGTYKNYLCVIGGQPTADPKAAAVAGIADCVAHLGASSASFAIPAWRKWSKLVTDPKAAKGWPTVFADGTGLAGAMLSVWEGIEPVGMGGGNLRALYADFLDEASGLLGAPDLAGCATAFRAAAERWHEVAEMALPADVPEYARVRELAATVAATVTAGDEGADDRRAAGTELWALRLEYDQRPPARPDLSAFGARLAAAYEAEAEAVDVLRKASAGLG
jgi:Butirosin biosynthesis protein H, N-terminal/Domain of unknown function (DUF4872)